MSRFVKPVMFVFCLSLFSFSAVGCGEKTVVIEDTRSESEINQEEEDYEKQMEEAAASDVTR